MRAPRFIDVGNDVLMDPCAARQAAIDAALGVGEASGFRSTRPVVLQDSNNVVVWLAPHEVVAKVGVLVHSGEVLAREVEVCSFLLGEGAPVAPPIGQIRASAMTGWPVSLWQRIAPTSAEVSDHHLAKMLHRLHGLLSECPVELPSYLAALDSARTTLFDDRRMVALGSTDLQMLRAAFEDWLGQAQSHSSRVQPLHGEPHLDNVILGPNGPTLIDFEAACIGPPEWDLASLPTGVAEAYGPVDHDLLRVLRMLNSARVATWCWASADHPRMRAHGQHHLEIVRKPAQ